MIFKAFLYSLINTLQRSKKAYISAINWWICWHICNLIYIGSLHLFLYISLLHHSKCPYGQLEKTSPADSSCPEIYRSQKYFLKYYGSFFLEDVANMQITNPKPFSSAKYPNNKHAVNSCTHLLTWGESKWYSLRKTELITKAKVLFGVLC